MAFWDRVKEGIGWDRDHDRDRERGDGYSGRDRSPDDARAYGTDCGRGSANCGNPMEADRDKEQP